MRYHILVANRPTPTLTDWQMVFEGRIASSDDAERVAKSFAQWYRYVRVFRRRRDAPRASLWWSNFDAENPARRASVTIEPDGWGRGSFAWWVPENARPQIDAFLSDGYRVTGFRAIRGVRFVRLAPEDHDEGHGGRS